MKYQIMMDSCGDLTGKMRECREVVSIPLKIRISGEEITDDTTLDCREMLKKIGDSSGPVSSSCPSPAQYTGSRDPEAGHVYILTGSSALTGSYTSAGLAARMMREETAGQKERPHICVIDSKSASAGQTLLAAQIMKWEEEGCTYSKIREGIHRMTAHLQTRFVVESLEMLEKNGRLNGLKAKIADVLNICPVLKANGEGTIVQCGQGRGIKKALALLEKQVVRDLAHGVYGSVFISHCQCSERAFALKIAIHENFPDIPVRVVSTGGISSMYAGKGGIIVAYVLKEGDGAGGYRKLFSKKAENKRES